MSGGGRRKVLVVGGGGREHALAWKLAQSTDCQMVFCAPGNAGTATEGGVTNVAIAADDFDRLIEFALQEAVDLVVVGPDDPLAAGIVDRMEAAGLRVFGPTRAQARIEWSKAHAKEFLGAEGIPTARYAVAETLAAAREIIAANPWARVVKADGLALGKGVFVCDDERSALAAAEEIFSGGKFGEAGRKVVIEERLAGEEMSLLALCDGRRLVPFIACQDHKRRFDGDRGPNTGGMGVYAPVPLYERASSSIESEILEPLNRSLAAGRLSFKGMLFIGLMVDESGARARPQVLEFNARFGDPETQALLPLLESDLLPALWSCTDGSLAASQIVFSSEASCCVVAAASTYPDLPSRGCPIEIGSLPAGALIFHAGTKVTDAGPVTMGGRVLCVTATGKTMETARERAYQALTAVHFDGIDYRKDIAARAATTCR